MNMVHNIKVQKRPRGRPQIRPDEETRRHIIDAARVEFHDSGYAGASIGRVAQRAGVSTKTMYRLIPTKADLFRGIISERISRFILEIDNEALDNMPIEQAIEHILLAYGDLTLEEEVVSTLRLVFAECGRFPEIATAFFELAIRRTGTQLENWLARQCKRGRIALDDPALAAGMLRGMMVLEPQRAFMLGQQPRLTKEQIAARARQCARLFLDGCRPKAAGL